MILMLKNQKNAYHNSFTHTTKEITYFKNALNSSCIDLFTLNSPVSFQNTTAISN